MKNKQLDDTLRDYKKSRIKPIFDYIEINNTRININKPIFAFCGLNGAKKTTTILSIARMFSDNVEIEEGLLLDCKTTIEGQDYDNKDNVNSSFVENSKFYLYTNDLVYKYKKFANQTNLEELLEQFEPFVFNDTEITEINFYLGKSYKKVTVIEAGDEDNYDYNLYFEIEENEKYDNSTMGTGELAFLILYYTLYKYENAVILLDEPEMFLSIPTQIKIMTLFRIKAMKKKDTIIYSTHSFYLLENLEVSSVSYISNINTTKKIDYCIPTATVEHEIMGRKTIVGTLLLEDTKALIFLQAILNRYKKSYLITQYNLLQMGGFSKIGEELKRVHDDKIDYDFIGVFDGDKRNSTDLAVDEFQWPYVFLPLSINLEEAIRNDYLNNTDRYNNRFNISSSDSNKFITSHQGADCHDWFEEFTKEFNEADNKSLINYYVQNIEIDELNEFETFINEFEKIIERSDCEAI